jgi:thiosulfate/3-mercaptopyruvate sulfurtransferase
MIRTLLRTAAAACAAAALALSAGHAQGPRDQLVVTPAWLAAHLHDPDLVLLHVGNPMDRSGGYAHAHIPGARPVAMRDVSIAQTPSGGVLEMLPADELHDRLQALGISDRSRIVVYFDGEDASSPATRIVYTLNYAGLGDRTSLLDGGLAAWTAAGQPTTAETTPARQGTLSPIHPRTDLIVDADWVQHNARSAGYTLIDARAPVFYDGIQATHDRKGHIPGAHSVPFSSVLDDQGRLKSPAELAALFRAAGAKPGDTIVGYCHIGQQATQMLFAARTLGYAVKLYDGSFHDWDRRNLPVETPSAAAGSR